MPRFGELPQPQHSMPVEAAGRAAVWRMRVASAGAVTEVRTPEEIGEWRKAEAEEKRDVRKKKSCCSITPTCRRKTRDT